MFPCSRSRKKRKWTKNKIYFSQMNNKFVPGALWARIAQNRQSSNIMAYKMRWHGVSLTFLIIYLTLTNIMFFFSLSFHILDYIFTKIEVTHKNFISLTRFSRQWIRGRLLSIISLRDGFLCSASNKFFTERKFITFHIIAFILENELENSIVC